MTLHEEYSAQDTAVQMPSDSPTEISAFGQSVATDHSAPRVSGSVMESVTADRFDALAAVGGVRGIIEAVVPTALFLVLYVVTDNTMLAVGVALAVCVVMLLLRAFQRIAVAPAVGGLLAMLISAVLAWKTGDAASVFLWGIVVNAVYAVLLVLSIVVRWPLFGVLYSLATGRTMQWRTGDQGGVQQGVDAELSHERKRFFQITWLWVGLFVVRLAVELPLYAAHAAEALGVAKLVLGLPLFALVVWFSWLLVPKRAPQHS